MGEAIRGLEGDFWPAFVRLKTSTSENAPKCLFHVGEHFGNTCFKKRSKMFKNSRKSRFEGVGWEAGVLKRVCIYVRTHVCMCILLYI